MAWKEDSFWKEYPQQSSLPECWSVEPRPQQGLRLKRRIRLPEEIRPIVAVIFAVILISSGKYAVLFFLFLPVIPAVIFAAWSIDSLLRSHFSRFYLFDAVTRTFVSRKPARQFDVLVNVATNPTLLAHLGQSDWRRMRPIMSWWIPYGRLGVVACSAILALFLLPPLFGRVSVLWWVYMPIIAAMTLFAILMYRRVAPSLPRGYEGMAPPPDDSDHVPYDRVRTATLHWDRLLQREYLLLEHDGGTLRYYNFTGDPLYLLRLWKQRMPRSLLQVDRPLAGTS